MKVLKIIGIIVLIVVLGFLAIGVFSGKQEYKLEINIDRQVAEVFQRFNDHEQLTEWLPEVKSFEVINETPNMIGSEYKMMIDSDGRVMELYETLTAYKENEHVEMEFRAGAMIKHNHFSFEESTNGTILIAKYRVEGANPFAKSMFALFTKMFKEIDSKNLERFKEFVEQQPIITEIEKTDNN